MHTGDLYQPLIERDLASVPKAVAAFRQEHTSEELFLAIARFAVLAFAPSEHGRHAVLAVLAAHDLRDDYGGRWDEILMECARYAASSRPPWSEPPILDPPPVAEDAPRDLEALRAAIESRDRLAGERWLAARLDDAEPALFTAARHADDALILAAAAARLAPILGDKGRFAVLRIPVWDLTSRGVWTDPAALPDLPRLIAAVVADRGSIESVHRVFLFDAGHRALAGVREEPASRGGAGDEPQASRSARDRRAPPVYSLARDLAQTLIAHAVARRLPEGGDALVAAAEHNRQNGPSFEEWT